MVMSRECPREGVTTAMPDEISDFRPWLRSYMEQEKLRNADVASRVGVTEKTIFQWKRGIGPQHPNQVRALLENRRGPWEHVRNAVEELWEMTDGGRGPEWNQLVKYLRSLTSTKNSRSSNAEAAEAPTHTRRRRIARRQSRTERVGSR